MSIESILQQEREEREKPAIMVTDIHRKYFPDPKTGEEKSEDFVTWAKIGVSIPTSQTEKISRLAPNPEKNRDAAIEWQVIGPVYEKWLEGQKIVHDGTPLETWAGCDAHLREALRRFNVHTVEELIAMPDHSRRKLSVPGGADNLLRLAKAFMESKNGSEGLQAALAERDEVIESLKGELEDFREKFELLQAKMEKPKRGRPRKEETTEAEVTT